MKRHIFLSNSPAATSGLGKKIGEALQAGSIIAEGAVVKQNQVVPPEVVAVGNPAKIARKINQRDRDRWNMGKQLYVDLAKRYLKNPMKPVSEKGE